MKIKQLIPFGAAACLAFAAGAQQQQSPFGTPALARQASATVGDPVVLNLTGVTVTDAAGQPVGPIQHILLSPAGCVDMAVLSLGGQRLVAVPWTLVGGSGATRAETDIATRAAFSLKGIDRAVLQQAPALTVAQLSQPQVLEQSRSFFVQYQQQPGTAAGGTSSQTDVNVGVGAGTTATNRTGIGVTNAGVGRTSLTNAASGTNQTGILSPTGPTNAVPGRPAFETNRSQPSIIPPGRPGTAPPANRPPANRPPSSTPVAPGASGTPTPSDPNQP